MKDKKIEELEIKIEELREEESQLELDLENKREEIEYLTLELLEVEEND